MIGLHVRLAAVLLAVMAYSDDSVTNPDPDPMPEAELNFLRPAINAPPLAQTSASFYAVKGSDRELRLFYTDGDEFLRPTRSNGTRGGDRNARVERRKQERSSQATRYFPRPVAARSGWRPRGGATTHEVMNDRLAR